jgi:hypothetical protein
VYEIILSADPKQKAPIMMTDRITVMKHAQAKDYLLCANCEDLFNKKGEKYTLGLMRTPKGFKILERLRVAPGISFRVDEETVFAGADIGLDMDQLAYFALSVFWRAGCHQWPSTLTVKKTYSIDLGPYLEPIREFLFGGGFPNGMSLMITAATDVLSQGYVYAPAPTVGLPVRSFGFLTCGILFSLFLADPMPAPYDRFCSVTAPRRPVFIRNLHDKTMHAAGRLYAMGRKAKNVT